MVSAIPYVMKSQMGMEIDYNVTNHCYRGLLRYEADAYDQGPPQSHAEDPGVFRVCTAASGELGEAPVFDKLSNVLLGGLHAQMH